MDRLAELKLQAEQIRSANEFWRRCQDGSYEMALEYAGYYRIMNEIRELERTENDPA